MCTLHLVFPQCSAAGIRGNAATAGKYERCLEIMHALHKVEELDADDPRLVPNPTNPCFLRCIVCKTFDMLGTCSHVLTVTDLIMQARPEEDRLVECDVKKMLTVVDENNKSLMGATKHASANAGAKALNKKSALEVGKYCNKKSETDAMNSRLAKARKKKDKKERAAVAKKLIGKKPATKSKKPASKSKKAASKSKKALPIATASAIFDSSDED